MGEMGESVVCTTHPGARTAIVGVLPLDPARPGGRTDVLAPRPLDPATHETTLHSTRPSRFSALPTVAHAVLRPKIMRSPSLLVFAVLGVMGCTADAADEPSSSSE